MTKRRFVILALCWSAVAAGSVVNAYTDIGLLGAMALTWMLAVAVALTAGSLLRWSLLRCGLLRTALLRWGLVTYDTTSKAGS